MNPVNEWFEEYACGCVSPTVRLKRELVGYCPKHGADRRGVFKNHVQVERTEPRRRQKSATEGR